jgi:hypothetical protein
MSTNSLEKDLYFFFRFPADEHSNGKIPSVIYYDQQGNVRAVGAETTRECIYDTAQDKGWIKVEWSETRRLRCTMSEFVFIGSSCT